MPRAARGRKKEECMNEGIKSENMTNLLLGAAAEQSDRPAVRHGRRSERPFVREKILQQPRLFSGASREKYLCFCFSASLLFISSLSNCIKLGSAEDQGQTWPEILVQGIVLYPFDKDIIESFDLVGKAWRLWAAKSNQACFDGAVV